MSGTERERIIALLRAAADLLEGSESVPVPYVSLHFTAHGTPDPAASLVAIAGALPCAWEGGVRRNPVTGTDHYQLLSEPASGRAHVQADAPAGDVCTATGEHMVTDWEPRSEITALLAKPAEGGEPA